MKNGKVHLLSTDIDVLVITPREGGKPSKVIERQEVKSGTNDSFSDAKDQLLKQKKRLAGQFDGGTGVIGAIAARGSSASGTPIPGRPAITRTSPAPRVCSRW